MAENIEIIKKLEVPKWDTQCPWTIQFRGTDRTLRCKYPVHEECAHWYYENDGSMCLVFEVHWQGSDANIQP